MTGMQGRRSGLPTGRLARYDVAITFYATRQLSPLAFSVLHCRSSQLLGHGADWRCQTAAPPCPIASVAPGSPTEIDRGRCQPRARGRTPIQTDEQTFGILPKYELVI